MRKYIAPLLIIWAYQLGVANVVGDFAAKANQLVACSLETNFSLDAYKPLENAGFAEPLPRDFKCFTHCLFERFGMTQLGVVRAADEVAAHLTPDPENWPIVHGVLSSCGEPLANVAPEKRCERGFELFKCLLDTENMKYYLG